MQFNLLALNDSKTEVVWFSSKFNTVSDGAAAVSVRVGDVHVHASGSFRVKSPQKGDNFIPYPLQICSNLVYGVIVAQQAQISNFSSIR